jgi:ParB/RepB/Spo0J family partition protein
VSTYKSRLADLVAPTITPSAKDAGVRRDVLHHIDVAKLRPSPDNPRSSYPEDEISQLADSLATVGQMQPITCYWHPHDQVYVIVAGHRRYHAAQLTKLPTLMAVVVPQDVDEHMLLVKRLAENTARIDLHPLDYARAIRQLMDRPGVTQEQVARMLGRSQAWVSGQLRLLTLSPEQQEQVRAGTVGVTQARAAVTKGRKRRKGPKQVRITSGGITAVVTFKRAADECSLPDALGRLRAEAERLEAKQAKDAA